MFREQCERASQAGDRDAQAAFNEWEDATGAEGSVHDSTRDLDARRRAVEAAGGEVVLA